MVSKSKIAPAIVLLTLAMAFSVGCGKSDKDKLQTDKQTTDQKTTDKQITEQPKNKVDATKLVKDGKYFCTMHPTQQSNEPGKCPICKMDMVLKTDYNKEMSDKHEELEGKFAEVKNSVHFEVNLSLIKSSECESLIYTALKSDAGVLGYHIDILNRIIHLYFDKTKTKKADIEKLVTEAGFDANDKKANPDAVAKMPQDCK